MKWRILHLETAIFRVEDLIYGGIWLPLDDLELARQKIVGLPLVYSHFNAKINL